MGAGRAVTTPRPIAIVVAGNVGGALDVKARHVWLSCWALLHPFVSGNWNRRSWCGEHCAGGRLIGGKRIASEDIEVGCLRSIDPSGRVDAPRLGLDLQPLLENY